MLAHVPYVNGPRYCRWPWTHLSLPRALLLFAGPLLLYRYTFQRWTRLTRTSSAKEIRNILALLFACSVTFMVAALYVRPNCLKFTDEFVRSGDATSYFMDALKIHSLRAFLQNFAHASLELHSVTHPPGPILFWWICIKLFGESSAPLLGTAVVALSASLGTVVIYFFARLWCADPSARLGPSFLYALLPGLIVNLPELDQIYPLLSMPMLLLWHAALRGRISAMLAFGATLFVGTFMAYNILTFGAPLALYALWMIARRGWHRAAWRQTLCTTAWALASALLLHVLLWSATGYDAIGSFRHSLAVQAEFALGLHRPYGRCIFTDLYDFFLGSGMLTLPLLISSMIERPERRTPKVRALTAILLLGVLSVDISGVLRCETSRVWLFLQPLVVVPAGLELSRTDRQQRGWLLGMQAVIVMVLRCRMDFLP